MLWRPLSHFRVVEDDEVRGDARDGVLQHAPEGGLDIRGLDGKPFQLAIDAKRFVSSVKCDDVFVYCLSNQRSDLIAEKFGQYCIEINSVETLLHRLRRRACATSKIDYGQLKCGSIEYRSEAQAPLADWALPEKVAFIKPERFAWQNEFRLVLPKYGAFDVENVILTIESGEPIQPPAPTQQAIFIDVGNLTEITKLHRF